jgi:hypothetical protein
MMSGVQGTQIADLDDDKKVSILDGLGANFFGATKSSFTDIDQSLTDDNRPKITAPEVPTKITSTNKPNSFFARAGLFTTKK